MAGRPDEIDFDSLFDVPGKARRAASAPPRGRGWAPWALALVVVALGASAVIDLAVEWLWFRSLGQEPTLATRIGFPLAIYAAALVIGALWLGANWALAARRAAADASWPAQRAGFPTGAPLRRLVAGAAVGVAALLAAAPAASWETTALVLRRVGFGTVDPIFGRDVGFFVFTLPFLHQVHALAVAWTAAAIIGAVALYAAGGLVDLRRGQLRVPPRARSHLLGLGAVGALLAALGWWLARFDLLFASRPGGVFHGPGYTDVHVRLPAFAALAVGAVLVAVVLLASARGTRMRAPVVALALLGIAWLGLAEALPAFVQHFGVRPDELARERPYIAHNIALTRAAWGVDDLTEVAYEPTGDVSAALLADADDTIKGVRLWDWQVLLEAYQQLQQIRSYYHFSDVDIDRYPQPGGERQVNLAVRELDPRGVRNPTWVNTHLEFTHGMGAVVSPIDEVDAGGEPILWMKDIPPTTQAPFTATLTQPRVYFGATTDEGYVVVRTKTQEFDYPAGESNVRTTYDGADGVSVGPLWRRLLFALSFGDFEILVSDALTAESRILYHRNIALRARRLAPFLTFDPDPYAVITADGRLVWLLDAYATTDHYPYSRPLASADRKVAGLVGERYARNSVKAVVDAYTGATTFYVVDDADPVIAAWAGVYPALLRPVSEMPRDLVAHWRYPESLFLAQSEILSRYHMADPDVFYNAEDLWTVPFQTRGQAETVSVQPYYVTLRLRGDDRPAFVLMRPFTPVDRPVMIAWLAARCDPGHYGELVVYRFAKGQQVYGPQQIENRIDNDTEISSQLTLWSQAGSRTIRGNMLVYPIGDALLYVEPLFLQPEAGAFPELKRVIVATKDRTVMRATLPEALAALVGDGESPTTAGAAAGGPSGSATGTAGGAGGMPGDESATAGQPAGDGRSATDAQAAGGVPSASGAAPTTGPGASGAEQDVATLVRTARDSETAARAAAADGDWEGFGRAMADLRTALDDLGARTGSGAE